MAASARLPPTVPDPFGLVPTYIHRGTAATSRCLYDLVDTSSAPRGDALLEYILFGDVWNDTLFDDVQRVAPPSHVPSSTLIERDGRALVDLFWQTLGDAVERSIGQASGSIVIAISGGLDAAALAACCVERYGASRVRAATVGDVDDDETRAAQASADALGIELATITPQDHVVDWPAHQLWPVVPRTATEIAWEAVTRNSTVVWGIGGDSLQRGDRAHYKERLRRGQWRLALEDITRSVMLHGCKPALGLRAAFQRSPVAPTPSWLCSRQLQAQAIAHRRAGQSMFRRGVDEMFASSWRSFFEWMAPQHNDPPIEHRFPFFDMELVNLMATVPTAPWCVDKGLLRAALRGRIPDRVRLRAKSPSSRPARIEWDIGFAAELNELLAESEYTAQRAKPGVFARGEVEGMLRCAAAARWS